MYVHKWCVCCCGGVRVYLYGGALEGVMTGLYCKMDCTAIVLLLWVVSWLGQGVK